MFDFASFLPQMADKPQVQQQSLEDMWAAAFPPTVYPPMGMSYPPVPTALPPPPPAAPSPMAHQGQGTVYSGPANVFQGPSAAVGGPSALQGPIDYTNVVHPMFYINHASFGQSAPPLPAFAAADANAWPDFAPAGGAGGRGQVGPQRPRRTQARASKNKPYAKAVPNGASSPAVLLPQPPLPIAEQENAAEGRRAGQRGEEYLCRCGKWVLVRRRAKHGLTHGVTWPCRMCKIINPKEDMLLSRKDALKRHIRLLHFEYKDLAYRPELKLLKPGEVFVDEWAIRRAMGIFSAGPQVPA